MRETPTVPTAFCLFLPPKAGQEISATEDTAVSFCTNQAAAKHGSGARIMPAGLIKTAHFKHGKGYVQVTGTIDRKAYKLSKNDGGGQYDTTAPPGATVVGHKFFVELVEPDVQLFCIRAGGDKTVVQTGRAADGCRSVVPGDYS